MGTPEPYSSILSVLEDVEDSVLRAALTGELRSRILQNAETREKIQTFVDMLKARIEEAVEVGEDITCSYSGLGTESTQSLPQNVFNQMQNVILRFRATPLHTAATLVGLSETQRTSLADFIQQAAGI